MLYASLCVCIRIGSGSFFSVDDIQILARIFRVASHREMLSVAILQNLGLSIYTGVIDVFIVLRFLSFSG